MTDKEAVIFIGSLTSLYQYQYDYELSKRLIGFSTTRATSPINGILTLIPIEWTSEPCPAPEIQPFVELQEIEETTVPAAIPPKVSEADPNVFEKLANKV